MDTNYRPAQDGVPAWVGGVRAFLVILASWNALFFMVNSPR